MGFIPDSPNPAMASLQQRTALLEQIQKGFAQRSTDLARKLATGELGADSWLVEMRRAVKDMHLQSLIVSKGGIENITPADYGRLGYYLSHDPRHDSMGQYQYLQRYAKAVQENALDALAGNVTPYSEKYLAWRSGLYAGSAKASFYRGLMGNLLPQIPGDGQTQCKTNCKCELRFEDGDKPGLVRVYWVMNPAEHCEDCKRLAQEWNPLEVMLPMGLSASDLVATLSNLTANDALMLGGPGSGNWGHAGRPGLRGGSLPRGAAMSIRTGKDAPQRQSARSGRPSTIVMDAAVPIDPMSVGVSVTGKHHVFEDSAAPIITAYGNKKAAASVDAAADKATHMAQRDRVITELSKRCGVPEDTLSRFFGNWEWMTRKKLNSLMAIRIAAAEEFGTTVSDYQKDTVALFDRVETGLSDWRKATQAELQSAYDAKASDAKIRQIVKQRVAALGEVRDEFPDMMHYSGQRSHLSKKGETLIEESKWLSGAELRKRLAELVEDTGLGVTGLVYTLDKSASVAENRALTRKVLREMYKMTQEHFARLGITEVTVSRGLKLPEGDAHTKAPNGPVRYTGSSLESWSGSYRIARDFAESASPFADKAYSVGRVMTMRVPVSRVLSLSTTGFGAYYQFEFTVLGSDKDIAFMTDPSVPGR